jgi:L-ascorbate metabolism protein UlaG (beta-lactamase superfamily)
MNIRRLGWAGIELEADNGERAVIDVWTRADSMRQFIGDALTELPAPTAGAARLALVTHLHDDHCDPDAIATALGEDGVLLRPAPDTGEFLEIAATLPAERRLVELGVRQRLVREWETVTVGAFAATAIPAVDGFGDPQVGWVVEADGLRVSHHGDTLFHGSWWKIRMRLGAPDVAFLPINGPVVSLPHRQPASPFNAVLTPAQAVAAAEILGAGLAVPIHYDAVHAPPVYAQVDDPSGTFARAAEEAGVPFQVVGVGENLVTEGAQALR